MRVPILKAGLVAAIAAAIAVSVTGCSILQDALIPRSEDASLNIQDTPVTISGNHVTTACFDFTTPEIGEQWELQPNAEQCIADVRWPGSDYLTTVRVRVQRGDISFALAQRTFLDVGYQDVEGRELTIDGQPAYFFDMVDPEGLKQSVAIIELPEGRFRHGDTPLTSIFIGGYALEDGDTNQVFSIANSVQIH